MASRSSSPGSDGRLQLLFLSQTLPFPPDGGVKVRTYNILRLLADAFDVTALCFYRVEPGLGPAEVNARVDALREFAHVRAFPIPQEHTWWRLVWDHLRSVLTRRAYTEFSYQSHEFRVALDGVLAERDYDLVHADSLDLARYFPAVGDVPIVCTHHDATSVQLRRRAGKEANRLRSVYIGFQADLMAREEREWCSRLALNAVVSEQDRDTLRQLSPDGRFIVVPNGVDTEYFQPVYGGDDGIVCVGPTHWFPNRDALQYMAEHILPALRTEESGPPVRWIGRATTEEQAHFRNVYRIELTGRVPDIRPFVAAAACYIVPIRVGGGTRVKILDAWAMGKAVVSTSIGCEGLDAVDGENILIRDDPGEFAAAVRTVLADGLLRERLGRAGRRTVEESYSWEVIGRAMIEEYRALIEPASGSPRTRSPGRSGIAQSGLSGLHQRDVR
jgi:polysaccharide biosynthesis protein PslH